MKPWPRYPECTPEQRRALWAMDQRERRADKRWRERVRNVDPALLCDLVDSGGRFIRPLDRLEGEPS